MVILQQYLADMDIEGYNIVGDGYRDKYFEKTLEEVKKCNGKILLYKDNEKIVGLIVGIINNDDTIRYDFKAPKRGKITELVVDKDYRGKGIGKILTEKIVKEVYNKTKEGQKASINLISMQGKEEFYEKCGFRKISFDFTGYGMIRRIEN